MQAQTQLSATIDVQKNLFYVNEKLAALIREGGTIDYEEYFNRRMLGYGRSMIDTSIDGETTNTDTYTFTNSSHFGNGNSTTWRPPIYYCGMVNTVPDPDISTWVDEESCMSITTNVLMTSSPLWTTATTHFPAVGATSHQPYGQYAALAYNYLDPVGFPMPIKLPPIFTSTDSIQVAQRDTTTGGLSFTTENITDVGLPELYLIKKNLDNTYTRTYFRHVYVDDTFVTSPTCNPTSTNPADNINGCLGKIQMLRLESCDTLLANWNPWSDGIIDAWIPSKEFWIDNNPSDGIIEPSCPSSASSIYTSAHEETLPGLPTSTPPNLTWVDVTDPDMNVVRATFLPSPLKIPTLMSWAGDQASSPTVSVSLEVQLSSRLRSKSFITPAMNFPRTLITTYDLSE